MVFPIKNQCFLWATVDLRPLEAPPEEVPIPHGSSGWTWATESTEATEATIQEGEKPG